MLVLSSGYNRGTWESMAAVQSSPAADQAATPSARLYEIDKRTPVPLTPMMANHQKSNLRDHLVAVQEIGAALA